MHCQWEWLSSFSFSCPRRPWPLTFDLDIRTRRDSCTVHLTAKFHHPMFNRSQVIVRTNTLTNKQTPLKTSTSLRYAIRRWVKRPIIHRHHSFAAQYYVCHFRCTFFARTAWPILCQVARKTLRLVHIARTELNRTGLDLLWLGGPCILPSVLFFTKMTNWIRTSTLVKI